MIIYEKLPKKIKSIEYTFNNEKIIIMNKGE